MKTAPPCQSYIFRLDTKTSTLPWLCLVKGIQRLAVWELVGRPLGIGGFARRAIRLYPRDLFSRLWHSVTRQVVAVVDLPHFYRLYRSLLRARSFSMRRAVPSTRIDPFLGICPSFYQLLYLHGWVIHSTPSSDVSVVLPPVAHSTSEALRKRSVNVALQLAIGRRGSVRRPSKSGR